jgi:hypothetical protein
MSREEMTEQCLEMRDAPPKRVTDQQAQEIMKQVSGCVDPSAFQSLGVIHRDKCIRRMKKAGLSIRQISRLTGLSFYLVQKVE